MNKRIAIIDYEVGNTHSVKNALDLLGYRTIISRREADLASADALILPGVGSFGEAMRNLTRLGLIGLLDHLVNQRKKAILGICLGMQILTNRSEEDPGYDGLGWIDGEVKRIVTQNLRVPQVGWNQLNVYDRKPLFEKHQPESHYYFDHSYHFSCDAEYVSATCCYGSEIVAAVQKENIFGVQFHPEKSHRSGLKLFRSFFNYLDI